jgi:uncharacterized protein YidB (DUF937 family)
MGLMDILTGMQNGPRGVPGDQGSGQSSGSRGGMSPITMALLGLLAYKAIKSFAGTSSASSPAANPADDAMPSGGGSYPGLGMDEILGDRRGSAQAAGGPGGGLLAGLGAGGLGGLLSGGLGDLLEQFQRAGKGDAAQSWIGIGRNRPIAPHELSQVLTPEQIDFLTRRTGLSRDTLLAGLSEQLPDVVDQLTPQGRLPTADEMTRTI